MKFLNKQALKVAAIFLIISFLWILYSDKVVLSLFNDVETLSRIQTYKGWFYVFSASLIIYFLVTQEVNKKLAFKKKSIEDKSKQDILFEYANDAIFIMDENFSFHEYNQRTLNLFECTREQLEGKSPIKNFSPMYQFNGLLSSDAAKKNLDLLRDKGFIRFEWLHTTYNNRKIFTDISLNQKYIEGNNYTLCIVRDITRLKEKEFEIKKKNEEYLAINEELNEKYEELQAAKVKAEVREVLLNEAQKIAQLGHWELDIVNNNLIWSDEIYRIFDLTPQELEVTYEEFIDKIHPEDRDMVNEAYTNSLRNKTAYEIEHRLLLKKGKIKYVLEKCNTDYDNKGKPLRSIGTVQDITKQKNAERALKESEGKYRRLTENSPDITYIYSLKKGAIYWSSTVKGILGFDPENLMSDTLKWNNAIHKEDIPKIKSLFENIKVGETYELEYRIYDIHDKIHWFYDRIFNVYKTNDEIIFEGLISDITERKNTQQKIYYAMMSAEERERSRVAKELHDGASPVLAAIKLYIQSLLSIKDESKKKELTVKIEQTISEAIQSISEISNKLSPHILQNFGLKTAVESFTRKIEEFKKLKISIEYKIEDRFAEDIEIALYRITTELINNSLKYAKAKNILIQYNIDDECVQMKYTDDGVGFDLEKVLKNRKGMGIFNMTNRIKSLNGKFDIKSQLNKGIEVEISVPHNE